MNLPGFPREGFLEWIEEWAGVGRTCEGTMSECRVAFGWEGGSRGVLGL